MTLYQSKPQMIEAVQWRGDNWLEVKEFASIMVRFEEPEFTGPADLALLAGKDGAQGWVPVPEGHWIVRPHGDDSDYWPVEADYFAAKYEAVGA